MKKKFFFCFMIIGILFPLNGFSVEISKDTLISHLKLYEASISNISAELISDWGNRGKSEIQTKWEPYKGIYIWVKDFDQNSGKLKRDTDWLYKEDEDKSLTVNYPVPGSTTNKERRVSEGKSRDGSDALHGPQQIKVFNYTLISERFSTPLCEKLGWEISGDHTKYGLFFSALVALDQAKLISASPPRIKIETEQGKLIEVLIIDFAEDKGYAVKKQEWYIVQKDTLKKPLHSIMENSEWIEIKPNVWFPTKVIRYLEYNGNNDSSKMETVIKKIEVDNNFSDKDFNIAAN